MSNPQVTMSGTATLRDWADKIENWNWRPGQLLGPVALRQMAANWDADLNHAVGLIADATLRAERAEARAEELGRRLASKAMALQEAEESVDRLQASKAELQIEIKDLYAQRNTATADCATFCGQNERLIKAAGAETVDGAIAAIEAQRAALERARALGPLVRLYIEYLESEQGYEEDGTMAWRSWQDQITEAQNALAAALGSGGAA